MKNCKTMARKFFFIGATIIRHDSKHYFINEYSKLFFILLTFIRKRREWHRETPILHDARDDLLKSYIVYHCIALSI